MKINYDNEANRRTVQSRRLMYLYRKSKTKGGGTRECSIGIPTG